MPTLVRGGATADSPGNMLASLLYGAGAALVLLAADLVLRGLGSRRDPPSPSSRLLQGARVLAVLLLASAVAGARVPEAPVLETIGGMALFGGAGLLALELAQAVGFAAMRGLAPAARGGQLAAAVTAAAHVVAIGILVANVFQGPSVDSLGIAIAAFAVGQATLLALLWLFRWLTSYDDREEILRGNVAAALSHGGTTIALALLIAHATDGEYVGPWPALRDYGIALAEGLVVWPLRQLLIEGLLLRQRPRLHGGELDRAIAAGDVGAGALEAATYLGIVLFVRGVA
jgi:uncharacterized membrane protein YjfL (UPF0719 family)